jgi:broad specificity phosphatase PhoE
VRLDALFTSDLVRARHSGEIIGAPHGLAPVQLPALREMAMGRWDGLTADEIQAREPAAFADWMTRVGEFPFPEGESVPDLAARAWPAFETIVGAHAGGSIAIVAHGGTNRVLLCRALGLPLGRLLTLGQDYGALSVLEWTDGGWAMRRLNDRPAIGVTPRDP